MLLNKEFTPAVLYCVVQTWSRKAKHSSDTDAKMLITGPAISSSPGLCREDGVIRPRPSSCTRRAVSTGQPQQCELNLCVCVLYCMFGMISM